jgi:hypothetical protein
MQHFSYASSSGVGNGKSREIMMKTLLRAALVAALGLIGTTAFGLTINSDGVVGTIEHVTPGGGVSEAQEAVWLQYLLNLDNGMVNHVFGGMIYNTRTEDPEYAGTIDDASYWKDDTGALGVPAGWEWVLAKYDGPNAGYVVWFLDGAAVDLPAYPWELWGNQNQEGYELSHFTVFNSIGVPDGGATVLLLGASLAALGLMLRSRRHG